MVKIVMTWQWANKKPRCPRMNGDNRGVTPTPVEDMRIPFVPPQQEKSGGIKIKGQSGSNLEWEAAAGEATAAARLAAEGVAAGLGETAAAAAVHHVEEDVGVDVDVAGTAHAAHASHATEAATAKAAAAAEHVAGVHQVIAIIISSAFSKRLVSHVL